MPHRRTARLSRRTLGLDRLQPAAPLRGRLRPRNRLKPLFQIVICSGIPVNIHRLRRSPTLAGYILRRILSAVPVLLGVSILVFAFIHLIPGDPATAMLGERATPENVARVQDQPGPGQADLGAVRHLHGQGVARRSGDVHSPARQHQPGAHETLPGHRRIGPVRPVPGDPFRDPGRCFLCRQAQFLVR